LRKGLHASIWGRWALASACALILWELIARGFITAPRNYIYDPALRFAYIPGARTLSSGEGFAEIRYNSLGLRGPEPDLDRHPFVVITGDSFTEADSMPDRELFTAVAQQNLGQRGRNVQVVNAGRNGDDFFQQLILLDRIFRPHHPDLVVLQVDEWMLDWIDRPQPFQFRVTEDELLEIEPPQPRSESPWRTRIRRPVYYSALANLIVLRYFNLVRPDDIRLPMAPTPPQAPFRDLTSKQDLLRVTLRTLQKNYPNLAILYLPKLSYPQLVQTDPNELLFLGTANALGLSVYNPLEALKADYVTRRKPHFGFHNSGMGAGHLNQDGHKVVGDFLAKVISENLK